jgi:hypothetical protein
MLIQHNMANLRIFCMANLRIFCMPIFKFFADRFSKCIFRILNAKLPIFSEAKLSFYDVVVFTTNLVYTFPGNFGISPLIQCKEFFLGKTESICLHELPTLEDYYSDNSACMGALAVFYR